MAPLEIATLILSLVALFVTIVGFFASLQFYRHGIESQGVVTRLLSKVESRVENISTQVGGLFDRTLAAALHRPTDQVEAQSREATPTPDANNPIQLFAHEAARMADPAAAALRLTQLRGLRFSGTEDPLGRWFFETGQDQGFNLFDGGGTVLYYGHFYRLEGAQIVERVRILMGRLYDSIKKVELTPDGPEKDRVGLLLRNTEVMILIPPDLTADRVQHKIGEYQPEGLQLAVTVLTQDDLTERLEHEEAAMQP